MLLLPLSLGAELLRLSQATRPPRPTLAAAAAITGDSYWRAVRGGGGAGSGSAQQLERMMSTRARRQETALWASRLRRLLRGRADQRAPQGALSTRVFRGRVG